MEKYTMVKTEVQPNGDIFLFYVDEDGTPIESTEGIISTIDPDQLQQLQENYVLEEVPAEQEYVESAEIAENIETAEAEEPEASPNKERWLDDEIEKLLIFYVDNKEAFQNPSMKKKHLWTVACKTMLVGKNPNSCETKLRNLKMKYQLLHVDHLKNSNDPRVWPFYDLCHQAFHDDSYVQSILRQNGLLKDDAVVTITIPDTEQTKVVKKMGKFPDEKVRQMLELYLRYKKEGANEYLWQKKVWEKIATQIGEDAEFWHKRFLNFKQHYIRMLEKRRDSAGTHSIAWPYMELYDEIYKNDMDFKRKYGSPKASIQAEVPPAVAALTDWNETEKTVLVKYYFDCLDEFQDPSIPNSFLWNEVGRLLDKKPEDCRKKYDQLKKAHLNLYIEGGYNLRTRKPLAILFDNIISQEIDRYYISNSRVVELRWPTETIDEMVQFLFDNIEVFKDPVCYFVCWAAIAAKVGSTIETCRDQWNDLTTLYKSILNDKKEDPDLQIDWRYIDIFDRIFDYGMDTKLLDGYETKNHNIKPKSKKIVVGTNPSSGIDDVVPDNLSDLEPEEFDEKSTGKRARGIGDPKQIKILEYYLKFKDKFSTTQRKKQALWETLAVTIGLTAEQCAHRFRNLKQVYLAYIHREIEKPHKPILWPYFALCKKVFGYRAIKNKMKQSKIDMSEQEEWTPREIKILISYLSRHFEKIESNLDDASKWSSFAKDFNKSENSCRDKFLDLRKSYMKIKTMMKRNPASKINWKYFKFLDEIYSKVEGEEMQVDTEEDNKLMLSSLPANAIKTELQDDDLQCIIVIPEGEEANASNAQIIINNQQAQEVEKKSTTKVWTYKNKVALVKAVLEYVKEYNGKFINTRDMWKVIGEKLDRRPLCCKKMYVLIKIQYKKLQSDNKTVSLKMSGLYKNLLKILELKPKFVRSPYLDDVEDSILREQSTYSDVSLPLWKVEQALKYYLEHVEEFVSPKYDRKYAWINLAKEYELPLRKIFLKINYLKQFFNSDTNEVNGKKFDFADTLKEILEKEFIIKIAIGNMPQPMDTEEEAETTDWTDDETEQLLVWYLTNLDKFKNPLFVPSYLWMEASEVLNKSAVACSNKMTEIRSQYSAMAKESPDALNDWRFYELCQKIYGTGKKNISIEYQ